MLRSVIVAVDATEASTVAQGVALDIGQRLKTEVSGIGVVDTPWITAPQAQPIGGTYYKRHRDDTVLRQTREQIDELISGFRGRCEAADVRFSLAEAEGSPDSVIEVESEAHDLIIVGRDTSFHFPPEKGVSDTVRRLARDDPRPLLVCPPRPPKGHCIVAAYDGSLASSKALHLFALLGIANGGIVHVVAVDESEDRAQKLALRGTKIFRTHGVDTKARGIKSSSHPAAILLDLTAEANMLVMGAFGRRGLRDYFFGSCTKRMLESSPVPLFIHH